jgi:hypothetical protein
MGGLPWKVFELGYSGRWPVTYSGAELLFYGVADSLHIGTALYLLA